MTQDDGVIQPHNNVLIVMLSISNYEIKRILINFGTHSYFSMWLKIMVSSNHTIMF